MTITPETLNCVCGHRFHGYVFADGLCFSLTEEGVQQWHVGNGLRGKNVTTLSAALSEFIKLMQSYGLTVTGSRRLWALKVARSFARKRHEDNRNTCHAC